MRFAPSLNSSFNAGRRAPRSNLWTSRLEELLNTELPRRVESEPPEIEDLTPLEAVASQLDPGEGNLAAGTLPHARERVERARQAAGAERRKRLTLFELAPLGADESARLQRQRGHGSAATRVVFRDGVVLSEASLDAVCSWYCPWRAHPPTDPSHRAPQEQKRTLAHISLPLLYNPYVNGTSAAAPLAPRAAPSRPHLSPTYLRAPILLSFPFLLRLLLRLPIRRVSHSASSATARCDFNLPVPPQASRTRRNSISMWARSLRSATASSHRSVAALSAAWFSASTSTREDDGVGESSPEIDKDFRMDQGLGEVRLLALIGQHDARGEQPLLSMLDYFYYKATSPHRHRAPP